MKVNLSQKARRTAKRMAARGDKPWEIKEYLTDQYQLAMARKAVRDRWSLQS